MTQPSVNAIPIRVLFVCMGNICRSPLAHGVMQHRVEQAGWQGLVSVDSAGTHFYHVGNPPDPRSIAVAEQHGYNIADQAAQQLSPALIQSFDYVLVMDKRNLRDARSLVTDPVLKDKIQLALDYCREPISETEVPDPYHDSAEGFEHVLQLCEALCDGLMLTLAERYPHLPRL
jgi:protein-tyrosine phosphatase